MDSYRSTLTHFIIEEGRSIRGATGELTSLVNDIVHACKIISNLVNHGALAGDLGEGGETNVQGETQKKLDAIANDLFLRATEKGGQLSALASEEMDDICHIPTAYPRGKYLLLFDPLDGSSNLDINGPVGSIFSILRAPDSSRLPTKEDFLQPGVKQIAAGYALYGPSTMLVLTTGLGVNGFTLDQQIGEFILTHPNMRIPEETKEFAINASNARHWEAPVKRYIDECLAGKTGPRGKDFNMRWVAAMVCDVHRIISRGGVFMYPIDAKIKDKGGRLRLMYEANPMAYIIEQAGGKASTGRGRIMEVPPTSLHQRVPVIIGSSQEVELLERYHREMG